jgi:uncharacterized protein involved in exopolysaccharide biosynthesis
MANNTDELKPEPLRLDLDAGLNAAPNRDRDRADESSGSAFARSTSRTAALDGHTSHQQYESHLVDYFRMLHKRRWTAVTVFILIFGSVTVYTFTRTPLFSARVQILIENENPNVVKFEEVYEQNKATVDYYQTQYRILESRALARRTIDGEKLWEHPLFGSVPSKAFAPSQWLKNVFSGSDESEPAPDAQETATQSRVIDHFLAALDVNPVRNSRLVDVAFRSPDPVLASRIANALARHYIEQNLEFKFLATKEATDFLNARTADQRQALERSEQALQQYREKTGAMALEDRQNIVVQRLADLNAAVTRARTERIEKESIYNQITAIQNDRAAVDTFPAILNNAFIQQLKGQLNELQQRKAQMAEKLGARHPDMVKVQSGIDATEMRIAAEVQKVVQALRNDFQAAQANERSLQVSLDQQRAEAQELNRAAIQYGVLQRDATSNQTMFAGLLERARETGISGELRTSNIRIVDEAEVPRRPSSPNKMANLAAGLLGGLFAGIGLAFFFEYLDSRIKQPDEIRAHLGLSFLGMIPSFQEREVTGPPLIGTGMPNDFAEASEAYGPMSFSRPRRPA